MVAWRYDFDHCRFRLLSAMFMPIEMTGMTADGGIIVHRADDCALSIVMQGKIIPWVDAHVVLDCQGRIFKRESFLLPEEEVVSL